MCLIEAGPSPERGIPAKGSHAQPGNQWGCSSSRQTWLDTLVMSNLAAACIVDTSSGHSMCSAAAVQQQLAGRQPLQGTVLNYAAYGTARDSGQLKMTIQRMTD